MLKNTFFHQWNTIDEAWRFTVVAFLCVRIFYALWSWAILTLQPLAIQNADLSGEPVLTVFNLQNSEAYTYLRQVNVMELTFRAAGLDSVTDLQTGSQWDILTGQSVAGPYEGESLSPSQTPPSKVFPYYRANPFPVSWLAIWQRFDANWYISLADTGYGGVAGDDHFPPLFPVLIRLLKPLFGSAFVAGLILSHLATLFAIKLLYETFSEWTGATLARRGTFLFLIFPASFFLFSVYSESIFLVTALLALRAMQKSAWAWAGFWAFCAILTRLQGAALIVPLLYLMLREGRFLRRLAHWVGLALPGLGGLFYLFLRSQQVSGAIPFSEPEWHARLVPPWETYGYAIQTLLSGKFTFIDLLNWAVVTLFLILVVAGWRKVPLEYNLYTAFSLLIILVRIVDTQPLISMSRYALMLFPGFFVLALAAERPWVQRLITYTFISLNLYLSAQFFLWGWVA